MPITANARRWDAGGVLVWLPASDGGCKHRVLPPAAKPPHPRPRRGRGAGGEGAHRQPPQSGPRGRGGEGRGGRGPPRRTQARPARQGRAGAKPPRPAGPRQGGASRTARTQQNSQFCSVGGGSRQLLTKLVFCWVRPVVAAAELWRRCAPLRIPGKSSEKRVRGCASMGGYYDTPPWERLVTTWRFWLDRPLFLCYSCVGGVQNGNKSSSTAYPCPEYP